MNFALPLAVVVLVLPIGPGHDLTDPIQHDAGLPGDAPDVCTPGIPNRPIEEGATSGTLWAGDDGADHYDLSVVVGRTYRVTMYPLLVTSPGGTPIGSLPDGIVLPVPNLDLDILHPLTCGVAVATPHAGGSAPETAEFKATPTMCKDLVQLTGCVAVVRVAMPTRVAGLPVPVGAGAESARAGAAATEATPPPCQPFCLLDYSLGAFTN